MIACKICVIRKGLKLGDKHIFENEADFIKHLREEHHLIVKDEKKMEKFFGKEGKEE